MATADKTPKKKGRPCKPDSEKVRGFPKITTNVRPYLWAQIDSLARMASEIKGEEVSISAVAALILEAGFDQVSAEGIARDAP